MQPLIVTEVLNLDLAPKKVQEAVKKIGVDIVEEPVLIRKRSIILDEYDDGEGGQKAAGFTFDEGERAAIRYVSTRHIDRDKEVLMPEGCILDEFEKSKVCLWGHNYTLPPIGSDQWIKQYPKKNPIGILAKTIYAETPRAEEVFQLVKAGHLRTSSVGFVPVASVRTGEDGWSELCSKLEKRWPEFKRDDCRRIFTKWILLEHSDVSVPANPNALTVAVAKQFGLSEEICEELGIDWRPEVQSPEEPAGPTYNKDYILEGAVVTDEEAEKNWSSYEEVLKPYPNEHACRLNDPNKYNAFRRNNNRFGEGIHAIFGRKKSDGKSELQALRFDKTKFTVTQAKKWVKDHDYKCIEFEPASNRDLVVEVLSKKKDNIIIIERRKGDEGQQNKIAKEVDLIIGRMRGKV